MVCVVQSRAWSVISVMVGAAGKRLIPHVVCCPLGRRAPPLAPAFPKGCRRLLRRRLLRKLLLMLLALPRLVMWCGSGGEAAGCSGCCRLRVGAGVGLAGRRPGACRVWGRGWVGMGPHRPACCGRSGSAELPRRRPPSTHPPPSPSPRPPTPRPHSTPRCLVSWGLP